MKQIKFLFALIFLFVGTAFAYVSPPAKQIADVKDHSVFVADFTEAVVHEVVYCPEVQLTQMDIVAGFVNFNGHEVVKNTAVQTKAAGGIKAGNPGEVDVNLKTSYTNVKAENNTPTSDIGANTASKYQEDPWKAWCQL